MTAPAPTVAEALRVSVAQLAAAGITGAATDARHLLAHVIGVAPDRLMLHFPDVLDPQAETRLAEAIKARLARQPVAQITGQRLFWGRSFAITPDVLDPRPETEGVVAAALEQPFSTVLDMGTGSGCILISLLADRPMAAGLGVDVSPAALAVARANADRHCPRAILALSDWFAAVPGRFDLIVSNPPYIAAAEMADLSPEVRNWEPHLALTPGGDGLDAYRALALGAPARLMPGGRLVLEIGPTQAAAVAALLAGAGFGQITCRVDFDGRDRVIVAHRP